MGDRKQPTPPPRNQRKPPPPPAPPRKRGPVLEDPAPVPPRMPTPAEALGQMLSMIVESNSAPPGTRSVSLYCSIPMECPACKAQVPAWTKHRCQQ